MERVKKRKWYWAVFLLNKEPKAICYKECGSFDDSDRFHCGNYFATKEEAEVMANKIKAVLKGADVIQLPSEEDDKLSVLNVHEHDVELFDDDYIDCEAE